MSYKVVVYGFKTEKEAEEARKKCQYDFCKWAAIVNDDWILEGSMYYPVYSLKNKTSKTSITFHMDELDTLRAIIDVNRKEIVLRISMDDIDKLLYALEHAPYTGDEHIDGVFSTFVDVLKEQRQAIA